LASTFRSIIFFTLLLQSITDVYFENALTAFRAAVSSALYSSLLESVRAGEKATSLNSAERI